MDIDFIPECAQLHVRVYIEFSIISEQSYEFRGPEVITVEKDISIQQSFIFCQNEKT